MEENLVTEYRRFFTSGSTWFFTVNLAERRGNRLLIENLAKLHNVVALVKMRRPFRIDAAVVLPDHLHCIWTLPPGDCDYPTRWNMIKGQFSRAIPKNERISKSREKRRERGVWQRWFWAHLLLDQMDFNRHMDYIHWNPVKHGYVARVVDWPYSSFGRFMNLGIYPPNWGCSGDFDFEVGE
jgi:putative transposase